MNHLKRLEVTMAPYVLRRMLDFYIQLINHYLAVCKSSSSHFKLKVIFSLVTYNQSMV